MTIKLHFTIWLLLFLSSANVHSQTDTVLLTETATHLFPSFPIKSSYSSLIDRNGTDYLFSANMESGLGIYNISLPGSINPVLDLGTANFHNLDVSSIRQKNNSLFLGIGDFQVNTNAGTGLVILDISNPAAPVVKDIWDSVAYTHGVSHLLIEGDYAYLSSMTDGIIILDISDENNILFVSHIQPDLNFPAPSSNAHNARGLKFRNDTLYVSFDRGGLRLIDVTDKQNPVEVYKYINPSLNSVAAAAYNDIWLKDNYAFLSVDYCGLEIIDISAIPYTGISWYNPVNCNFSNWSGAPIHTNELKTANGDSLLFISAGQSELLIFDISDPLNTSLTGVMANLTDSLATYGVDVFEGTISLSFVHTPFHIPPFTPFYANPGGLKLLEYTISTNTSDISGPIPSSVILYPNPSKGKLIILSGQEIIDISVNDILYRQIPVRRIIENGNITGLELENVSSGIYFLRLQTRFGTKTERFIVERN